jgi:hypothetical protein
VSSREEVAKLLAQRHYLLEPAITEIRTLSSGSAPESGPSEPIKLLEVNANQGRGSDNPFAYLAFQCLLSSRLSFPEAGPKR